jgi:hypothetical protein
MGISGSTRISMTTVSGAPALGLYPEHVSQPLTFHRACFSRYFRCLPRLVPCSCSLFVSFEYHVTLLHFCHSNSLTGLWDASFPRLKSRYHDICVSNSVNIQSNHSSTSLGSCSSQNLAYSSADCVGKSSGQVSGASGVSGCSSNIFNFSCVRLRDLLML